MRKIITLTAASLLAANLHAQAPAIEWQACFGDNKPDFGYSMNPVPSGGYIIGGFTSMYSTENQDEEFLVIKTDDSGDIEWQKNYGGSENEQLRSIRPTADGGYIMAGETASNNGDVSGNHGGQLDWWIVKTDADGEIEWQKCLGGSGQDGARDIYPVSDGYIAVGYVISEDGDINATLPNNDGMWFLWVVKLDLIGNIQWKKLVLNEGGYANSVSGTADGGCIIAGRGMEFPVSEGSAMEDFYVLKLDASGNTIWEKYLGGTNSEEAFYVKTTPDGGCIVTGSAWSEDGDVSENKGGPDAWLVKLDETGDIEWERSFGGSNGDASLAANFTSDGGYIATLLGFSNDGDFIENQGDIDCWVVRLDNEGNTLWLKNIGSEGYDDSYAIHPIAEGGFIMAGNIFCTGDIEGSNDSLSFWMVKLDEEEISGLEDVESDKLSVYPVPAKEILNFSKELKAVEIFTVEGKKVLVANNSTYLNVSNLQLGTYIIRMQTADGKVTTQKIIKN